MSKGRAVNPLPLRRAVIELVDVGLDSPELWEAVADGSALEAHAASVALVALLVGQAAGLRPALLQDLGLAAMVHDAGYAALPPDVAASPAGLHAHPGEGARLMLRQRGFHEGKLRRLRALLDHHRDHAEPRGAPSAAGQILRVAEDYATLLRVHRARISPADALGAMSRAAGKLYHPVLLQVMVNVLGRYPPGSLLELADGRYARSVSPARGRERWDRPLVRLYDLRTRALAPERVDLAMGGAVARVLPG